MSLKDNLKKLKEKLDAKNGGSKPTPQEAPPAKVPKSPKAEVVYKCGHTLPVGELKNHDCRQCQQAKRNGGKKKGKGGRPHVARLPQGSTYQLQYYEEDGRKWLSLIHI